MSLPTYRNSMTGVETPSIFRNIRRRRIIWSTVFLSAILLFFFAPSSFWEHSRRLTTESRTWLNLDTEKAVQYQDPAAHPGTFSELHALLHMVASTELQLPSDLDASQPLSQEMYDPNFGVDIAWLREPDTDPPVIVFSKTYCPFSKKAKALLDSYDLDPRPKIVEVDLREDARVLKAILTRLTNHSTFPNVFIGGKSYGGSDDLTKLHEDGDLIRLLQSSGALLGTS